MRSAQGLQLPSGERRQGRLCSLPLTLGAWLGGRLVGLQCFAPLRRFASWKSPVHPWDVASPQQRFRGVPMERSKTAEGNHQDTGNINTLEPLSVSDNTR